MTPRQFIDEYGWDEVDRICEKAGTKRVWFHHLAQGYKNCSVPLAEKLVEASGGTLDIWSLVKAKEYRETA